MPKSQGFCIFCGGSDLTKEHIFPEWQKSLVPTAEHFGEMNAVRHPEMILVSDRLKQGDISNYRVRKVCKTCNNGWMSRLEAAVKPILTALILGNSIKINKEEQLNLARWIVIKSMVLEQTRKNKHVVTTSEHHWIKNKLEPPIQWLVWIDQHDGDQWRRRWNYQYYTSVSEPTASVPSFANTQTTTIGIGKFLFHAFSSSNDSLVKTYGSIIGTDGLIRLWPLSEEQIVWPRTRSVMNSDIDDLIGIMRRLSR